MIWSTLKREVMDGGERRENKSDYWAPLVCRDGRVLPRPRHRLRPRASYERLQNTRRFNMWNIILKRKKAIIKMEETKEWNIIDCSYREEIFSSIWKINAKREVERSKRWSFYLNFLLFLLLAITVGFKYPGLGLRRSGVVRCLSRPLNRAQVQKLSRCSFYGHSFACP